MWNHTWLYLGLLESKSTDTVNWGIAREWIIYNSKYNKGNEW